MIAGIALLLLTGLCWVGIAVTVSMAAERRLDMGYIMFAAGLIISAVTVPFILCSPGMTGSPDRRIGRCSSCCWRARGMGRARGADRGDLPHFGVKNPWRKI